jgi:ADP-ribosylglycohydrolase
MSPEKIKEKYGIERVTEYLVPTGHKWFDGEKAGATTDDTALTLAVANGLIEGGFGMDIQARKHIEAYESTKGWGSTTKMAVRNLINGAHWQASGVGIGTNGRGNGVPMKISPVIALIRGMVEQTLENKKQILSEGLNFITRLCLMTHKTQMALCSTVGYGIGLYKCFDNNLDTEKLPGYILEFGKAAKPWFQGEETDDVVERFALLSKHNEYNAERLIAEFGGGSCYCYNSIPFTLMFFLNNPRSINSLYDCISAGGDADSNGAMLGAMLGALNGEEIFPKHLVDGLDQKDRILAVADALCDKIGLS